MGAPPPPVVRLSPASVSMTVGDSLYMQLRNDGEAAVLYNTCGSMLQRQVGPAWVHATVRGNCGDVGWPTLNAHSSAVVLLDGGALPDLPAGTYRAVLGGVEAPDGRPVPVASESFVIAESS